MKKIMSLTILSVIMIGLLASSVSAAFEVPPPTRGDFTPSYAKSGWKIKLIPEQPVVGIPLPTDPTIKFK